MGDRRIAIAVLVVVLAVSSGACRSAPEPLRLDGAPRLPADEGVATALSRSSVTLDGSRSYDVSDDLRAFGTATLELEPMIGRKGQYVQIGLDGDTMIWMAGVSRVVDVDGSPSAYYSGTFEAVEDDRFVFSDGTTFAARASVEPPPKGATVTVRIDVRAHAIVEVQ